MMHDEIHRAVEDVERTSYLNSSGRGGHNLAWCCSFSCSALILVGGGIGVFAAWDKATPKTAIAITIATASLFVLSCVCSIFLLCRSDRIDKSETKSLVKSKSNLYGTHDTRHPQDAVEPLISGQKF